MSDWTELKLGQAVRVRQGDDMPDWAPDWAQGTYVIVGMEIDYRGSGEVDISIASQDEIEHKLGSTDGFKAGYLVAI